MKPFHATWEKLDTIDEHGVVETVHAMVPTLRFAGVCEDEFEVGGHFEIDAAPYGHDERTDAEHRSYMAQIGEGWKTLPESKAKEYPTPNHLRKRLLIKCGYAHETSTVFDTEKQAMRAAAFMRPLFEFDVVICSGNVVKHFRAMSQAYKRAGGMDKETFRASRDRVLDMLATELLKIKRSDLKAAAEKPPA